MLHAKSILNAMSPFPRANELPMLRRLILVLSSLVYAAGRSGRGPSSRRRSHRPRPKRYSPLNVAASPCCVLVQCSMFCSSSCSWLPVTHRLTMSVPRSRASSWMERPTPASMPIPSSTSPRTRAMPSAAPATACTRRRRASWTATSARCARIPASSARRSATAPRSSPRTSRRSSSISRPSSSIPAHVTHRRCPLPPARAVIWLGWLAGWRWLARAVAAAVHLGLAVTCVLVWSAGPAPQVRRPREEDGLG